MLSPERQAEIDKWAEEAGERFRAAEAYKAAYLRECAEKAAIEYREKSKRYARHRRLREDNQA